MSWLTDKIKEFENDPEFLKEALAIEEKEGEISRARIADLENQVRILREALLAMKHAVKCVHLDMSGKHRYACRHDTYKAAGLMDQALMETDPHDGDKEEPKPGKEAPRNHPKVQEACRKALEELRSISKEEFAECLKNAPDTGVGRLLLETGTIKAMLEEAQQQQADD